MLLPAFLLVALAFLSLLPTYAAPSFAALGPVTLHIIPVNETTSRLVARNVGTAPGSFGAAGWDIYFIFDHSKGRLAATTLDPVWQAMDCGFSMSVSDGTNLPDPNMVALNGACLSRIPEGGMVGNEVTIATLEWADCQEGFLVDLRTGLAEFNTVATNMTDVTLESYLFKESDLFDGGACGNTQVDVQTPEPTPLVSPTPVVVATEQSSQAVATATPAPAPSTSQGSQIPLLLAIGGIALLVIGGVFIRLGARQ